jgi:hypothetical protein
MESGIAEPIAGGGLGSLAAQLERWVSEPKGIDKGNTDSYTTGIYRRCQQCHM